jgi:hypothetical protein
MIAARQFTAWECEISGLVPYGRRDSVFLALCAAQGGNQVRSNLIRRSLTGRGLFLIDPRQ